MLTTDDAGVYEELKILRNIGLRARDDCVTWGYNSRLDTLQAAILLVKLGYVDEWTEKRRNNARIYQQLLAEMPQVQLPQDKPNERAVYHTFVIEADRRDYLKAYLDSRGIGIAIHYPVPIHLQKAAADLGYRVGCFPVAERQAQRFLSLPVYPELRADELEYVADCICAFYRRDEP